MEGPYGETLWLQGSFIYLCRRLPLVDGVGNFGTIKRHLTLISFPRIFNIHSTQPKRFDMADIERERERGGEVGVVGQQSGSPLGGRVFHASFTHFMQFLNINFPLIFGLWLRCRDTQCSCLQLSLSLLSSSMEFCTHTHTHTREDSLTSPKASARGTPLLG